MLALLTLMAGLSTAQASDEVYAVLVQRGFEPWPQAFLTETPFAVGTQGNGLLDAEGYKIRLPRSTPAKWVLVAASDKVVIVDVAPGTGPVALSTKALAGLGMGQGNAAQKMQILALRRLSASEKLARAPSTIPVPLRRPEAASVDVSRSEVMLNNPALPAPPAASPLAPSGEKVTRVRIGQDAVPFLDVTASAGKLALQVGYFSTAASAGKFADKIEALGLPSVIERVTALEGDLRWKVLAGPFSDDTTRLKAKTLGGELLRDAYSVVLE